MPLRTEQLPLVAPFGSAEEAVSQQAHDQHEQVGYDVGQQRLYELPSTEGCLLLQHNNSSEMGKVDQRYSLK